MMGVKGVVASALGIAAACAAFGPEGPFLHAYRESLTRYHLDNLKQACRRFMRIEERIPMSLGDLLNGGYLGKGATRRSALYDACGTPYFYLPPTFTRDGAITSAGPDRQFATADDLYVRISHPDERSAADGGEHWL